MTQQSASTQPSAERPGADTTVRSVDEPSHAPREDEIGGRSEFVEADVVVLYDGLCGFCDRTVQFVLARDREAAIRFAPLQGAFASGVIDRHPELADIDSLVLVTAPNSTREAVRVRSAAALELGKRLTPFWKMVASLAGLFPRGLGDWAYDAFAKRRYRWFGRLDACPVPDASVRARFLD